MSLINIDELNKIVDNKQKRKNMIYDTILQKCHSRIKTTARLNNNMNFCFYSVPKYIFGIPLYDSKSCILYVISSLIKNGFDVRYTHPNLLFISCVLFSFNLSSQEKNLSEGPFEQLIIRGVTLINGNGSPPLGPVDIVIEKNIIKSIKTVGYPGVEINERRRPKKTTGWNRKYWI